MKLAIKPFFSVHMILHLMDESRLVHKWGECGCLVSHKALNFVWIILQEAVYLHHFSVTLCIGSTDTGAENVTSYNT